MVGVVAGNRGLRRGAYGLGGALCVAALMLPLFVSGLSSSASQYETTTTTTSTSTSTSTSTTTPSSSVPTSDTTAPPTSLPEASTTSTSLEVSPPTSPTGAPIPELTVSPGDVVSVSGTGCDPDAEVVVTLDEDEYLTTLQADASGSFVGEIVVPASTSLGTHLLTATCSGPEKSSKVRGGQFGGATSAGGVVQQFLRLIVIEASVPSAAPGTSTPAAAPGSSGGPLPRTGSDTLPLVALGLGMFTLGVAVLYGARYRRVAKQV